tara:strand:- start:1690 stop:1848 length:159 start_codon:yes stop_codon:yes gene_type:complete
MNNIYQIKEKFPTLGSQVYKEFIDTHFYELSTNDKVDVKELFLDWAWFHGLV